MNAAADDVGIVFEPNIVPTSGDPPQTGVKAHAYVWNKPPEETLDSAIWSYDAFVEDNLYKWVGSGADRSAYIDVDIARGLIGTEEDSVTQPTQRNTALPLRDPKPVTSRTVHQEYVFGHGMLKHFCFEDGYINLNNGMPLNGGFINPHPF